MQKIALVTGARHRIGAAIAEHLAAQGWRVFAHVRSPVDDVPDGCEKVAADLAEADCADAIFAQLAGAVPDLLVNNASLFEEDNLDAPAAEVFDRVMPINARAPMLLTSKFAHAREEAGGDALIVNILDAKLAAPNPDYLSYTLTKGALTTLTEVSARALAGRGIRVNAIAPAMMLPSGDMSEEEFEALRDMNSLGRALGPDDLLVALDSLVAQPLLTGQVIWLDGGQRFMALERDVAKLAEEE